MKKTLGKKSPISRAALEEYWQIINHNQGKLALAKIIRYLHERRRFRERWVGALRRTGMPIMAIMGDADPISGKTMIRRYKELLPHAGLTVLNHIGHYPQLEAAPDVWANFLSFQQRIKASLAAT
jgi:pimeloyl-ACP methyl ester carboxylesterase